MSRDDVFSLPDDRRFEYESRGDSEDRESWLRPEPKSEDSITRHWGWLLVLGVAWLLFELSVDPAISVMVASIGLGWNHFLSSLWLWRRDPDRKRGRACAAFYLAAGFWRITALTFVLIAVATIISLVLNFQHGKKDELVTGIAMLIVLLCFLLAGLTTCVAVMLAMRRKLKVWLDPQIRIARRHRQWPPRSPGPNRLGGVITSTVSLLAIVELFVGYGFLGWLIVQQQNNGPKNIAIGVAVCITAVLPIVVAAGTVLGGREWAQRKLTAKTPHECWPERQEPKL